MADDDAPFEFAEPSETALIAGGKPWNVLIVDDEPGVHEVTEFALKRVTFLGRPIHFLHAYSGAEALEAVRSTDDLALIFLDVVMESDDAGLKVVQTLREDMDRRTVRIILRTGQPGIAPERRVIIDYDINDYKAKTELSTDKLFVATIGALRAYRDLQTIEDLKLMAMQTLAHETGLEQQIMDSLAIPLLHTDTLLSVTGLNNAAADLLRKSSDFILGQTLHSLVGAESASRIAQHRNGALTVQARVANDRAVHLTVNAYTLADASHGGFIIRLEPVL